MKNHATQWKALAVLLAALGLLSGCQSKNSDVAFQMHMNRSVRSLQAGDLDEAGSYAEAARLYAKTYDQKRSIESVNTLIGGSRAMMQGDVSQATNDWANIQDPHLNREVRVKADVVMGVKVPLVAVTRKDSK